MDNFTFLEGTNRVTRKEYLNPEIFQDFFFKIARLENCEIIKLLAELNDQRDTGSEALSINDGTAG